MILASQEVCEPGKEKVKKPQHHTHHITRIPQEDKCCGYIVPVELFLCVNIGLESPHFNEEQKVQSITLHRGLESAQDIQLNYTCVQTYQILNLESSYFNQGDK